MKIKLPLYLIGFMASGKTALGKKLARKLNCPFYDLDEEIEKDIGKSVNQIFKEDGEAYFRQIESKCLAELKEVQAVISLGGGTLELPKNISLIKENGTSVFLDVEPHILIGRLRKAKTSRPLIAHFNAEEIAAFVRVKLDSRRKAYESADYQLKLNNPSVKAVLNLLEK